MIEHEEHDRVYAGSDRSFGIIFAVFLTVIAGLPLLNERQPHWWMLCVAAALFAIACLAPSRLAPLNRFWLWIGSQLHKMISPIILGLIFFVAVTPTAIIMRLADKDLLHKKRNSLVSSYWIMRDHNVDSQTSMRNQF